MSTLKSRLRVLISICLFVVAIAAAFAGPRVTIKNAHDFGFVYANEQGFADQQLLRVAAVGAQQVYSFAVASRVGGVILQAVAQPEPSSGRVSISYDRTAQDGHRFKIKIADASSEVSAPDWEVIPLIRFVDTPYTAAMSLLGKPKNQVEKKSSTFFSRTMFIEIHPAFRDTVLGNNFIFTDAMLVGGEPGDMRTVTESLSEPIPGYSDLANFDEAKSSVAADRIADQLSEGGHWNTYIFTDVGVNFTFSIKGNQLEMTGEPFYAFLSLDEENQASTLNSKLTDIFRANKVFYDLNPKIYELDRRAFQLAALLRNFKAADTEKWKALVKSVSLESPEPSMETPRAWRP
jgi:hypothetical protein